MRRFAAVLALLALLACGSDATGPAPAEVSSLSITGGNFQHGTVMERLDNPLSVVATSGGDAVSGVLICWVAVTEGAGEPFVPCAETNAEGEAETPWRLGEVAGDHTAEARAMVNDTPKVVATYELEAGPGPAVFGIVNADHSNTERDTLRSTLDLRDEYENDIPWRFASDCCAYPPSDDSTAVESRHLAAEGEGTGVAVAVARGDTVNTADLTVRDTTISGNRGLWITVDWRGN